MTSDQAARRAARTGAGDRVTAPTRPTDAPDERHLQAFRRVLLTVKIGRTVSVNTVRDLLTAADLAPAELGALFRHACLRGWLQPTGRVVPSTDPAARGRLVREYRRRPIGLQQPRKAA